MFANFNHILGLFHFFYIKNLRVAAIKKSKHTKILLIGFDCDQILLNSKASIDPNKTYW